MKRPRRTPSNKRRKPGKGRRRRRLRLVAGVGVPVAVIAAGILLLAFVQVTQRFEGKLWQLPSRVYSDRLSLRVGDSIPLNALTERLERMGYDRAVPDRPGTFRVRGGTLETVLREFRDPRGDLDSRHRVLRFAGSRVVGIRDGEGRPLRSAVFEPELIASVYGEQQEDREVVRLNEVPQGLLRAVLAAEDARFYRHHGIDARSVVRAALANLRSRRIVQGGSTITQQTVKNLYLGQQRTWWRKAREIALAAILDARYSKERILEVYLNEVYLGQRGPVAVCGVQAGARYYFGRELHDLSLAEWALLAGTIRSPGHYDPWRDPELARQRRDLVLDAMQRLEFIGPEEADRARAEPLRLAGTRPADRQAPYVVDLIRGQLAELYPAPVLSAQGLRIFTTLDTVLQAEAQAAVRQGLERLEQEVPRLRRQADERVLQGAMVVTRPATGEILALVGGRDYRQTQFNRAVQARRQPGSCFKPFVYLAAFEAAAEGDEDGLVPASSLLDEPLAVRSGGASWHPANYDGEFRGPVTARQSLEESLNVPTVRAAMQVGLKRVAATAKRAGFTRGFQPLPSLALGAQEVTPLELAAAYGTLANQGRYASPRLIQAVTTADGEPRERRESESAQVVRADAAYLVNDVLQGVMSRGTGRSASLLGYRGVAAGKTGTSDDTRDAWFVGYDTEVLALVWVGYDDNASTGLSGARGALPIWVDFMGRAGRDRQRARFPEPPGLVRLVVDPTTGRRAVRGCPERTVELFPQQAASYEPCQLHRRGFWRRLGDRFRGRTL